MYMSKHTHAVSAHQLICVTRCLMSWAVQQNQHQLLMSYEQHLSVSNHHLPCDACADVLHM